MFKDSELEMSEQSDKIEELIKVLDEVKKLLVSEQEPKIFKNPEPNDEFGLFIEDREKEARSRIPGNWNDEKDLFEIIYKLGTSIKKTLSNIPGVYLLSSSQGTWSDDKEVDDEGKVKNGKLKWFLKLGSIRKSVVSTIEIEGVIENYELKRIDTFRTIRGELLPFDKENISKQF